MVPLSTSAQTEPGSSRSTCQHHEHPKTWFRWALRNLVISSTVSLMRFAQTMLKGSRCPHSVVCMKSIGFKTVSFLLWFLLLHLLKQSLGAPGPQHPKTWFRWALQNWVISSMVSLMTFAQTVLKGSRSIFSCLHVNCVCEVQIRGKTLKRCDLGIPRVGLMRGVRAYIYISTFFL